MSKAKQRRSSRAPATRPRAAQPRPSAAAVEAERGQVSWRSCLVGVLAGEVMLFVLSNVALGLANAAFGNSGFKTVDGGVVGVSTFLAVFFGGFLAARLAGRFGLYQGVVVGAGFIAVGAIFQFAQEAQIVHSSLASGTHTLVDLGPMSMGNLISGDMLALVGGSLGGLFSRRR
ncbi:MAG TPA: YrzE family protein [Candidatus Deferrimicrobium sp.]|nr:YrzE family protein [Candidatus Deferrimicrobium sp.]